MSVYWGASLLRLSTPAVFVGWTVLTSATALADVLWLAAALTVGMLEFGLSKVEVGDTRVRFGLGPWAFPRRSYPWSEISSVRPVTVSPFFGRGARGVSLYCIRPGKALEFSLADGRHFTIAVGRLDACFKDVLHHLP